MQLKTFFTVLLLYFFAQPSFSCRPSYFPVEDRVNESSAIYVGYVTGVRYVDYEESLESGNNPEVFVVPEAQEIKVFISETLKGSKQKYVFAITIGCGSEVPKPHEKVVVFIDPRLPPYVELAKEMLHDVEKSLKEKR